MIQRIHDIYRPVDQRRRDFREVERQLSCAELHEQASRCMECGIPFCHGAGCPLGNVIPEFNAAAAAGEWRKAWEILSSTSSFPEFTCRVCPALCEGSCTNGIDGEAVMIRQIEKKIVETAGKNGWMKPFVPEKRNGRRVAVIGAGPAGLAAADELNRLGYQVTVYEAHAAPGGLLRYGIPDFKLEKSVIERRIERMRQSGIGFVCGTRVGKDISADYLARCSDAVVLAIGTPEARDLRLPGRELSGIHFALEFLQGQNRVIGGEIATVPVSAAGKRVVVIGGGDTGSDCVGTSLRQGAASVLQIEIMPEPPAERSPSTPWPQWPYLLRTSSSHKEGGERQWGVQTTAFTGEHGHVAALETVAVKWEFSPAGRPLKFAAVPGSERKIGADLVLLAMGFTGVRPDGVAAELGLAVDPRGRVLEDPARKVFCCGDTASGASLVVRALADGKRTAHRLDAAFRGM